MRALKKRKWLHRLVSNCHDRNIDLKMSKRTMFSLDIRVIYTTLQVICIFTETNTYLLLLLFKYVVEHS